MKNIWFGRVLAGVAAVCACSSVLAVAPGGREFSGTLADGALWRAEKPADWNGTLLLFSHGYAPRIIAPELAPKGTEDQLLAAGYALAASSYAEPGWAIKAALQDQPGTVAAFAAQAGKPRYVIAWGQSMGGLITTALAENPPSGLNGALALCSSMGGAVGMMNQALDGGFALKTLLPGGDAIELVQVKDDRANAALVGKLVAKAQSTPQGQARLALAGVLAGLPGWTDPAVAPPAAADSLGQEQQMAAAFVRGVMLPRQDQEARAGGAFSWNRGVDYRALLAQTGRRGLVESLYRRAGLDLDTDLARLNGAASIAADPAAVDYVTRYFTPLGKPSVPLLAVQLVGDGMTPPDIQGSYVIHAGTYALLRAYVLPGAGHCQFTPAQTMAAVHLIDQRVRSGSWGQLATPALDLKPTPMPRACFRGQACLQGEK